MKKVFSKRNLIIMFFPVVFVLIVLTLGLPQRVLTAVTVGEARYSIAAYNYYYYEAYYGFANEHFSELAELGLNTGRSLKNQNYDADTTWAEHFRQVTLEDLQEYTILRAAAAEEGFDAAAEVEAVRAEHEQLIRDYCVANNISEPEDYLTQLYDAGMTEALYYDQLADRTLAEQFRSRVLERLAPTDAEEQACRQSRYDIDGDYATADVVVAYFPPAADRVTGESEQRQWDNALALAQAAQARAQDNGGDLDAYCAVAAQFSQLGDETVPDGHYAALNRDDVEQVLEEWCFDPSRRSGDSAVLQDDTGCYVLYFNGWGEHFYTVQARQTLLEERYDQWLAERADSFAVKTNGLAMLIAR